MPIICFVATSAEMFTSASGPEKDSVGLSYRVKLDGGNSVDLATEENFRDLDGHVVVVSRDDNSSQEERTFGKMSYFEAREDVFAPSPACYFVRVLLSNKQLEELLAAARIGRVPSQISIWLMGGGGIETGWQPDGSGSKWDNKASPELKVVNASFTVPMITPIDNEFVRDHDEEILPPTRLQFDELTQKIDQLVTTTNTLLRLLFWAVMVIGGLLIIFK